MLSLDAFRGLAIAGMILANNPGDWSHVYRQLDHAAWHGWTFTDTIFPAFLFISGVAMALTIARRRAAGIPPATLHRQFFVRAAILFAIGLLLNAIPAFDLATLRVPGVLQRIAMCIAIAAPLLITSRGQVERVLVVVIVALLTLYSVALLALPVPGFDGTVAAGSLEPGRDAGAYIDRWLFGDHLWARSKTWDPEGLLSTLPAVCTLLFGAIAGTALLASRSSASPSSGRLVIGFIIAGFTSLALGAALAATLMPINKNLWTPSYCLWMNGWALLAFAAFYWYLDAHPVRGIRERARRLSAPFSILGINALFVFVVSGVVARLLDAIRIGGAGGVSTTLKSRLYAPFAALPVSPEARSLLFAIAFDLAMLVLAYALWKRRWLIRV